MSKKQLLNESEIRRFMKLANLEPLAKGVLSEMVPHMASEVEDPMAATPDASMDAAPVDVDMGGGEEVEVEVGDDADPEKKEAFEAAVQALADAMGIEVELESQEEQDTEGGEEMHNLDSDKDEGDEDEGDDDEGGEGEKEMDEASAPAQQLSEDELVETVLARVTARLVAEAKKKKISVKERMKQKKGKHQKKDEKENEKKVVEEATDAKGGGPLLSKGGNKHDVYKGHADMAYAKGEKGGKGGHSLETTPAKSEHTVTHGGKNLATLGGNKKKV